MIDPRLYAAVAQLVRDVNENLKMNAPASFGKIDAFLQKSKGTAPAAPAQKQWVDIFGTPIGDLSAWTTHDEPRSRFGEIAREEVELSSKPERELALLPRAPKFLPPRRSLIVNLLSRCLSRRPDTCPT